MVTPLDFIRIDFSSTGETDIFLQNMDWPLAVGQVMVEINGVLVNLLEGFRLVGGLKALA
jgi:hypothetical protein